MLTEIFLASECFAALLMASLKKDKGFCFASSLLLKWKVPLFVALSFLIYTTMDLDHLKAN